MELARVSDCNVAQMEYPSLPFGVGTHWNNTTVEFAFILRLHIADVLLCIDYKLALFKGGNTNQSLLFNNFPQIISGKRYEINWGKHPSRCVKKSPETKTERT